MMTSEDEKPLKTVTRFMPNLESYDYWEMYNPDADYSKPVVKDYGKGLKTYMFEMCEVCDSSNEFADVEDYKTIKYMLACEVPTDEEIKRLIPYCQCYVCRAKSRQLIRHASCYGCLTSFEDYPCNDVLKATREYIAKNALKATREYIAKVEKKNT